jgi:hypothetical protein
MAGAFAGGTRNPSTGIDRRGPSGHSSSCGRETQEGETQEDRCRDGDGTPIKGGPGEAGREDCAVSVRRFKNRFKDHSKDRFEDQFKDRFKDQFKDQFEDRFKDHSKDRLKDQFKDRLKDHSKDRLKDQFKNRLKDHSKDRLKDGFKDRFKDHSKDRWGPVGWYSRAEIRWAGTSLNCESSRS